MSVVYLRWRVSDLGVTVFALGNKSHLSLLLRPYFLRA